MEDEEFIASLLDENRELRNAAHAAVEFLDCSRFPNISRKNNHRLGVSQMLKDALELGVDEVA